MFLQGAAIELLFASLMIALPALFVIVYQWGEKNGKKQIAPVFIQMRQTYRDERLIQALRQSTKDTKIFNTVEEWRNELA